MELPKYHWKNKKGTADRECSCGSWKNHWINHTGEKWPPTCCIEGCSNKATLGAHIINSEPHGEWIVPACDSCNKRTDEFSLKNSTTLFPAKKD